MVIQVVNFNLEGIGHQDYLGATVDVAPAFKALNGLISKVWLSDEENNIYGGVYTWENEQAMETFAKSELFTNAVKNNPNFVNLSVKDFGILDGPSKITGMKQLVLTNIIKPRQVAGFFV